MILRYFEGSHQEGGRPTERRVQKKGYGGIWGGDTIAANGPWR